MSPRVRTPSPTRRQAEFLLAFGRAEERLGIAPTFQEIADEMGGISPSAVFGHAVELEGKGYCSRNRDRVGVNRERTARNLSLTEAGRDFVAAYRARG